jgi:NTE family protein
MPKSKNRDINLALQAGGAHGAFAWGVVDYFLETGELNFNSICATSIGSMMAGVFAYNHGKYKGDREKIREGLYNFWLDVSKTSLTPAGSSGGLFSKQLRQMTYSIMDVISHIMSPYQFNPYNIIPLKSIVEKHINFEELASFKDIKLFITATNVRTGKIKIFSNNEINLDVILASSALPYWFQAVKIEDDYYWNGAFTGNPALFPLFYEKDTSSDILLIHINPMIRSKLPTNPGEIMNRMNEITFNSSLVAEYRAVAFVNKILNEGWLKDEYKNKLRHMHMHAIRADSALESFDVANKYDTSWENISRLKYLGRKEAENWEKANLNMVGKNSTTNLDKLL